MWRQQCRPEIREKKCKLVRQSLQMNNPCGLFNKRIPEKICIFRILLHKQMHKYPVAFKLSHKKYMHA
jgi:hypothetical protein